MVVTEFDGFHRTFHGGITSVTTDILWTPGVTEAEITVSIDGETLTLSQTEAIGLASDLLRALQLASGGSG